MSYSIPDSAKRLQATVFVNDAELANINRSEVMLQAEKNLAQHALNKLVNDCITIEGEYLGYHGNVLKLDVYVITPIDLHRLILEARMQGERDASKWDNMIIKY